MKVGKFGDSAQRVSLSATKTRETRQTIFTSIREGVNQLRKVHRAAHLDAFTSKTSSRRATQRQLKTMPAPSQLAIATSSLNRLVKEEASYHKESQHQQDRIAKLEAGDNGDDENAEFTLKQEVSVV